jgi:transposase
MESTYNYANNYNLFQYTLPLTIDATVELDDNVKTFVELMREVNIEQYLKRKRMAGRQPYDPTTMLLLVLFAYTNQIYSLRKIADACKYDIRFIGLAQGIEPSHQAFYQFINNYLLDDIKAIFYAINKELIDYHNINTDNLYIDGTKFEANANKYSFVWKKAVLKFQEKLYRKIDLLVIDFNDHFKTNFPVKDAYKQSMLLKLLKHVTKAIDKENVEFVYGKGKRKNNLQKLYERCNEYLEKLKEYEGKLDNCGTRNSYSKVDKDATFMNMKYDYYNRTGVFKPGYNLQVGVSDQFILCADVFSNPTDTKTFIPFMNEYKKYYNKLPLNPIGDAGYGSYDNYFYCKENSLNLTMKYNYFNKVNNDKKFKKKIYHSMNFERIGQSVICPRGYSFDKYVKSSKNNRTIYPKIDYYYECQYCSDCPDKSKCTKSKGNRKITINPIQEAFYKEVDTILTSDYGKELCKNRSIQAEGAFGVIKQNFQYSRLHRRSMPKVKMELFLICIGFNIKKHINKINNMKNQELS